MLCLQVFANKIVLSEIRKSRQAAVSLFRYLSVAFQISVSYVSDICFFKLDVTTSFSLYYVGLLQLKEIY